MSSITKIKILTHPFHRGGGITVRRVKKLLISFVCLIVLCAFAAFISSAFAEVVSYESTLVWRTDTLGDYVLPPIADNSIYTLDFAIPTKGLIKSITATWKFEGEVSLAVSADDGLHYTPIINGVPLTEGFVEGSSLTWKAKVGPESKLTEVRLVYTDSSGVTGSFGNPLLSGFKFRKGLHILGSPTLGLFNYQVKIRIGESSGSKNADVNCEGHIMADFNDIRFVLPDGKTTLDYYLERVIDYKPNRIAEFFIKVPQIPPSGITLYVYYGNPAAQSFSDPQATFDFYERFAGTSLDAGKWMTRVSPGGSVSVSNEMLSLDAASVLTNSFEFKGGIIEYSATAEKGFETRLIIRDQNPESESDSSQIAYASAYKGAEHCIAVGNIVRANAASPIAAGMRYDYRLIVTPVDGGAGENITFERYSAGFVEKLAQVSYKDVGGPREGFIGLKTAGVGEGQSLTKFHWMRVRKYTNPEPSVESSSFREEAAATPFFRNIISAPNGDLALAEGYYEGIYVPEEAPVSYAIRIMVPSWKGRGVSVNVSADAGKTYKRECSNNTYYYASKKDFSKGSTLKARIHFKRPAETSLPSELESLVLQYALGSIVVLSPNETETLHLGSKKEIRWTAWDYERSYPMKLEYSLDGGKTFSTIVDRTENSGSYLWHIPVDTNLITHQAKVRISDVFDNSVADESDKSFSIVSQKGLF